MRLDSGEVMNNEVINNKKLDSLDSRNSELGSHIFDISETRRSDSSIDDEIERNLYQNSSKLPQQGPQQGLRQRIPTRLIVDEDEIITDEDRFGGETVKNIHHKDIYDLNPQRQGEMVKRTVSYSENQSNQRPATQVPQMPQRPATQTPQRSTTQISQISATQIPQISATQSNQMIPPRSAVQTGNQTPQRSSVQAGPNNSAVGRYQLSTSIFDYTQNPQIQQSLSSLSPRVPVQGASAQTSAQTSRVLGQPGNFSQPQASSIVPLNVSELSALSQLSTPNQRFSNMANLLDTS